MNEQMSEAVRVGSILGTSVAYARQILQQETDLIFLEGVLKDAMNTGPKSLVKVIQARVNAVKKLQAHTLWNKWIEAAVQYGLQMHWQGSERGGLSLMAMTVMAENGGHKLRKLFSTEKIEEAIKLSIEIYSGRGRLNCDDLVTDTWWQYGWDPETMDDLRSKMRMAEAHVAQLGYRQADWIGWANWRKKGDEA